MKCLEDRTRLFSRNGRLLADWLLSVVGQDYWLVGVVGWCLVHRTNEICEAAVDRKSWNAAEVGRGQPGSDDRSYS